jgi:hypothetical protein
MFITPSKQHITIAPETTPTPIPYDRPNKMQMKQSSRIIFAERIITKTNYMCFYNPVCNESPYNIIAQIPHIIPPYVISYFTAQKTIPNTNPATPQITSPTLYCSPDMFTL